MAVVLMVIGVPAMPKLVVPPVLVVSPVSAAVAAIAAETRGISALVGCPILDRDLFQCLQAIGGKSRRDHRHALDALAGELFDRGQGRAIDFDPQVSTVRMVVRLHG